VARQTIEDQTNMSATGYYTYFVTFTLLVAGLFIVVARGNLIKKLVGLGIFQTSVYLLYIGPAKLIGGTAPILATEWQVYSNPLPHVLILTAIVVGVATLALGLALVVRIREAYDSIEEEDILAADVHADQLAHAQPTVADQQGSRRGSA
jgi:multicomponent Na+:H+ antiporter subunit C